LIIGCYAVGDVTGESLCSGGLVGDNYFGEIIDCWATGTVHAFKCTGGLVGWNERSSIDNSYSIGDVNGNSSIGGLVGEDDRGSISNCYSTGTVSGTSDTGGLVGNYSVYSTVAGSFWDTETSGTTDGVGNIEPDPNGVAGKTTSEMQVMSIFVDAGWDMVNVWDIGENQTYPFLRIHLPSDINKDGETNLYDLAILALNWLGQ
jgi:hypothetical protein